MRGRTLSFALAVAVAWVAVLAGCVPVGQQPTSPTSTLAPTETRSTTPSPTSTVTPDPESESESESETLGFTRDQLITLCVADASEFAPTGSLTIHTDLARMEVRPIDPPWFIYIPVTTDDTSLAFTDMAYVCIYGGTPSSPEKFAYFATKALTEEQIQQYLTTNPQG